MGLLQKNYGLIGVKYENGMKKISMVAAQRNSPQEIESVTLNTETVFLKAECNFNNLTDTARFYYSLDGEKWKQIGSQHKMIYNLAHFMGYRFALFNYATKSTGGYVDFDWFKIDNK